MATRTRAELQAYFQNGMIPTAQHFKDLIDSAVNKKDDDFFGLWRPGVAYNDGDVVIYGKSMYMLKRPAAATLPCEPPDADPKQAGKNAPTPPADPGPYCSTKIPPEDANWCQLDFNLEDDDWEVDAPKEIIFVKNPVLNAGIGTTAPCAKLHVADEDRGALMFNPVDGQGTEFYLYAKDYPDCNSAPHLLVRVDDQEVYAESHTKTGFRFGHTDPGIQTASAAKTARFAPVSPTLMVLTREADQPQAGIGVEEPQAVLHVRDYEVGEIQLLPEGTALPTLELRDKASERSLRQSVDGAVAAFDTDAENGFLFRPAVTGPEPDQIKSRNGDDAAEPVVSIDRQAHLGVGTDAPRTNLEVHQAECGAFQVCLQQINPAVAIVNEKPNGRPSYFTAGADNSFAVLKTDAPCGFVFKTGAALDSPNHPERNINEGKEHVYVDQEGKVGIGKAPDHYELDIHGTARLHELYLATNKIRQAEKIEDALDLICRLTPIRFKWENPGDVLSKDQQFGLYDYECADIVPEVVKITGRDEKGIAYQNLVPLLIRAIQEQQTMIDELSRRVSHLERRRP